MNVFDKAIEEIKTRGWNQGAMEREDGSVCLLRACAYAKANDNDLSMLARVISEDFGAKAYPDTRATVWVYNDHIAHVESDVIAVLEKASVREQEKI